MVDPVRNRRNDCYLTFSKVNEAICTHTMTKYPSSVMCLGFVASNGLIMLLHWFPTGYWLTVADYINILREKLVPWVQTNLPRANVVLQQDGAPAHTSKATQNFLTAQSDIMDFWPKSMLPPYSLDANPLDFAFWPHVKAKACSVHHSIVNALKATVNEH